MGFFRNLTGTVMSWLGGVPVNHYKHFAKVNPSTFQALNTTSIYLNSIYQRLSTDIANLNLTHVQAVSSNGVTIMEPQTTSELTYLLKIAPNEYDTPITFWTSVAMKMLVDGIAIVLPVYKSAELKSFKLIHNYTIDQDPETYELFVSVGDKKLSFDKLLVFKNINHGLHDDMMNITSLINDSLTSLTAQIAENKQGLRGFIKLNTNVRDQELLKYTQNRLDSIMQVANSTGIGHLQQNEEFQELKKDISTVSPEHLDFLKKQLFENYGINEDILTSNYNSQQYTAYIKSIIFPLQKIIVEEINKKLFSRKALTLGYKVINPNNALEFVSPDELADTLKDLKYVGVINSNEARALIGYDSYAGGDRYETNLNAAEIRARDDERLAQGEVLDEL